MNLPFSLGPQWPPAHFEDLKRHYRAGKTSSQIARALNATFGTSYSRNAVIGMIHRHIPEDERFQRPAAPPKAPRTVQRRPAILRMATIKPASASRPLPPTPKVETRAPVEPRPWLTRKWNECAYPVIGEGADTYSCCAPTDGVRNYCTAHWKLTHTKAATPAQITAARRAREAKAKSMGLRAA